MSSTTCRGIIALTCLMALGPLGETARGQQFVDETNARFPLPALTEYTNQCTVGDLDGDFDLDIVFANGGNFNTAGTPQVLRIFINDGNGVFTDESIARTGGLTFLARACELGDVERDGDLDIIIAQDFNRQPTLLINNGSGVFTNETASRLPIGNFSSSRAQFADVDNDGDLDLYFTNGGAVSRWGAGRGKLWLNNGNGVFTDVTTTQMPNQNVSEPQDCIFGDIDGDLDLDIRIASTASNSGRLYRNNGSGTFASVAFPSDNNCYSYDFGDINNDGDLDLLGANGNPTAANAEILLNNNGSGTFTNISGQISPNPGTDDNDSKFLDIDNDGDLDLIIAALGGTAERIYANNGLGFFSQVTSPAPITPVGDSSLDVKVADFDNDGRYDIVTCQGESGSFVNRIYRNTGPQDTIPPTIVNTEQLPDTDNMAGPYVVRAMILDAHTSDRGFHDKGVYLNWTVNGGPLQAVEMLWSGNSLWRGVIPGVKGGGTVEYWVTATDWAGNEGTGATKSFFAQPPPCPGDTNNDGSVGIADLLAVIGAWGLGPATVNVQVLDFEFDPAVVNVHPGDTIQWNWVEGIHTATSGSGCSSDGTFDLDIDEFNPVQSYAIPGAFEGAIPYFCMPHCGFGMTGEINAAYASIDVNHDTVVGIGDLLAIIGAWGSCP